MAEYIKVVLKIIKCMVMEHTHGLTEGNILVHMKMTKNKDMDYIIGQMEDIMMDNGGMESVVDMEK
jgi:hypothetical protein